MRDLNDMQWLLNAVSDLARRDRSHYHLTLGGLIDALKPVPADRRVVFDRGSQPGALQSYRGYYADLAFERCPEPVRAASLLAVCQAALGHTFTGYKGGDFVMGPDTPLWLAAYGECGPAIVGVTVTDTHVVLVTKDMD